MYLGENTRKVLLDMSKDFLLMSKQAKQPYFSDKLKNNSNCVIILSIFSHNESQEFAVLVGNNRK